MHRNACELPHLAPCWPRGARNQQPWPSRHQLPGPAQLLTTDTPGSAPAEPSQARCCAQALQHPLLAHVKASSCWLQKREDAQRAKDELNNIILHDNELKIGWGKTVVLPAVPLYTPAGTAQPMQGLPGMEAAMPGLPAPASQAGARCWSLLGKPAHSKVRHRSLPSLQPARAVVTGNA